MDTLREWTDQCFGPKHGEDAANSITILCFRKAIDMIEAEVNRMWDALTEEEKDNDSLPEHDVRTGMMRAAELLERHIQSLPDSDET